MKKAVCILALFALAAMPVVAQETKTGEPGVPVLRGGCSDITDDAYDGTIGSMTCVPLPAAEGVVLGVNSCLLYTSPSPRDS